MARMGYGCESGAMDSSEPPDIDVPSVSRLPLVAMGALVVFAALLAIALGLRGPKELPAGTPEAAAQDYLEAVIEGEDEAVLDLLAANRVPACRNELGRTGNYGMSGVGFELDNVEITGDTARVELTQRSSSSGDPFEGTRRFGEQYVELIRENGEWKVDGASWPWRLESCLRTS
jgi:hypothetical protein